MTGEFFSLSCKITAGTSIAQGVFTHLSIHSSKGISSPHPPSRRWKQLLTHLITDAWLYLSVLDIHGKSGTVRSRFLRILWFVRKVSLETVATTEAGVPRSSVLILLLWDGGSCVCLRCHLPKANAQLTVLFSISSQPMVLPTSPSLASPTLLHCPRARNALTAHCP